MLWLTASIATDLRPRRLHQRLAILLHDARAEAGDHPIDRREIQLVEPVGGRQAVNDVRAALEARVDARSDDRKSRRGRRPRTARSACRAGSAASRARRSCRRSTDSASSGRARLALVAVAGAVSAHRITCARPGSSGPRSVDIAARSGNIDHPPTDVPRRRKADELGRRARRNRRPSWC